MNQFSGHLKNNDGENGLDHLEMWSVSWKKVESQYN